MRKRVDSDWLDRKGGGDLVRLGLVGGGIARPPYGYVPFAFWSWGWLVTFGMYICPFCYNTELAEGFYF